MVPESTLSKPVSKLKKVVLPAPFGPMRAVILLRRISSFSTSTARKPPNVLTTLVAVTTGVLSLAALATVKGHLLSRTEDSLRTETRQEQEAGSDEDEAQHRNVEIRELNGALET